MLDDTDAVLKSVDDHAKHNEEVKKYNKMMRNKHMLFAIIGFFCICKKLRPPFFLFLLSLLGELHVLIATCLAA